MILPHIYQYRSDDPAAYDAWGCLTKDIGGPLNGGRTEFAVAKDIQA